MIPFQPTRRRGNPADPSGRPTYEYWRGFGLQMGAVPSDEASTPQPRRHSDSVIQQMRGLLPE